MKYSYMINGKFLTQRITGVQRYAIDIVNALDNLDLPFNIEIAIPPDAKSVPQYKRINVVRLGHLTESLWEQVSFPIYALSHKKIPVNLCNACPLIYPGIVCIHDMKIKVHPEYFSTAFRMWYQLLTWNCCHRAKKIFTVSEFSKQEIHRYYHRDLNDICVVPSSWEHYERISCSESALQKYHLQPKKYVFALGSMDPTKNFKWIFNMASKNPDMKFVIGGLVNNRTFAKTAEEVCPPNMSFLGYVSDEEAKTLMKESYAFLFPSFYEGFGLPPLEALSAGADKIIVSDIPVMHELFGDAVNFIDPYNDDADLNGFHNIIEDERSAILDKFSWEKSARLLLSVLCDCNKCAQET